MNAKDLLLVQHVGFHSAAVSGVSQPTVADRAFDKLTDAQMRVRPAPAMNSLAWLVWHIARAEDLFVNVILVDQPQILDDAWRKRLGVDRRDIGTGMASEEVGVLTDEIDIQALRDYRDAVGRRTREIIGALPEAGWQGQITAETMRRAADAGGFAPAGAWLEKVFVGRPRAAVLAGITVGHSAQHIGEAFTVRSLGGFGVGM
jgi:hypothetical protein